MSYGKYQRAGVEALAIDMCEVYINGVSKMLPDADIVHDKFHIAKHLGEAVDKARKAEHRGLNKKWIFRFQIR